jgi:GntR family transcriptional regulator / MocR family aminotransferase
MGGPRPAPRHSLTIEHLSPHAIGTPTPGLMIGYGAPSKPSFGGALAALLAVLADIGVT